MLRSEPLHQTAHPRLVGVELTQIPHFALTPLFGDGDSIAPYRYIDADEYQTALWLTHVEGLNEPADAGGMSVLAGMAC
jgi:hypothetical protein